MPLLNITDWNCMVLITESVHIELIPHILKAPAYQTSATYTHYLNAQCYK